MENTPNFDLYIDEATNFRVVLSLDNISKDPITGVETVIPFDLTSVTLIEAQIRSGFGADSELLATFTTAVQGTNSNQLELYLAPINAPVNSKNIPTIDFGWYDIFLTTTESRRRLVGGRVFMNQAISR